MRPIWRVSRRPTVGPGLAAVAGPVDAVAVRDVVADAGLAGAGVDHVRVGRRDRDRADGRGREVAVGDASQVKPPSVVFQTPPAQAPK